MAANAALLAIYRTMALALVTVAVSLKLCLCKEDDKYCLRASAATAVAGSPACSVAHMTHGCMNATTAKYVDTTWVPPSAMEIAVKFSAPSAAQTTAISLYSTALDTFSEDNAKHKPKDAATLGHNAAALSKKMHLADVYASSCRVAALVERARPTLHSQPGALLHIFAPLPIEVLDLCKFLTGASSKGLSEYGLSPDSIIPVGVARICPLSGWDQSLSTPIVAAQFAILATQLSADIGFISGCEEGIFGIITRTFANLPPFKISTSREERRAWNAAPRSSNAAAACGATTSGSIYFASVDQAATLLEFYSSDDGASHICAAAKASPQAVHLTALLPSSPHTGNLMSLKDSAAMLLARGCINSLANKVRKGKVVVDNMYDTVDPSYDGASASLVAEVIENVRLLGTAGLFKLGIAQPKSGVQKYMHDLSEPGGSSFYIVPLATHTASSAKSSASGDSEDVGFKSGAGSGSHKSKTTDGADALAEEISSFDMSTVDLSDFIPGERKVLFMNAAMLERMEGYRGFTLHPTGRAVLGTTLPVAIDHIKESERKHVFENKGVCALHGALHRSRDCIDLINIAAVSAEPYGSALLNSIMPPR